MNRFDQGGHVAPFELHVEDSELDDLRRRLRSTRHITPPPRAEWTAGVPSAYLRALLEYWEACFDWRAVERRINSFENLRVTLGGIGVHCVRLRGPGEHNVPIVLVHGWPSSFIEMLDLAARLVDPGQDRQAAADSFDVIVPSLPGFGCSDASPSPDWGSANNGEIVTHLMQTLGYERFAIHASRAHTHPRRTET